MALDSYETMHMREMLMVAAMDVTRFLESQGHLAIPMQITHYRVHPYKDIPGCWTRDFDHTVCAIAAGLGELGLHGVPITAEYGTRQMFISVVTEAPLPADAMYNGPALCDRCMACAEHCHMQAFDAGSIDDVSVGERTFGVMKKDIWRCMWSKRFMLNAEAGPKLSGLDVTIDPPENRPITEADVQSALSDKGRRGGMQTWYSYADRACERVCVPPHLRPAEKEAQPCQTRH
jgi:ferredoxin